MGLPTYVGQFNGLGIASPLGSVFYVGSTVDGAADAVANGSSPGLPFATLDYAVGKCTASVGDVIVLLPGHAENIAGATGAVLDVAGITVIGVGNGLLKPKLTLTTAAGATLSVTAASVAVKNVAIHSNFTTGVTAGITAAATADGLLLEDVLMTEAANTKEFLIGISIAAACTDVTINRLRYCGTPGGSTTGVITGAGAMDRFRLLNSYIQADSSGALVADGAASLDWEIGNCRTYQVDADAGLGITAFSGTTGIAYDVRAYSADDAVAGVTGDALAQSQCYTTNDFNVNARYLPILDT